MGAVHEGMATLRKVAPNMKARGTLDAHATAIKKFYEFLTKFKISLAVVTSQGASEHLWCP